MTDKLKKRTYRVKPNTGKHYITVPGNKGKVARLKVLPGGTFEDYPTSKNVVGFEHKLEVIEAGVVVPDEDLRKEIEQEEVKGAITLKKIQRGGDRYDVINVVTGEKINGKPLTNQEAEALLDMNSSSDDDDEEDEVEVKEEKKTGKKVRKPI